MASPLVLIVEDDEDVRKLLLDLLERNSYRVIAATNSGDGLKLARQERPACLAVDWVLGTSSGLELVMNLRREPHLAQVPILVMSGRKFTPEDIARALESGADDFIEKPFSPIVFLGRVAALLRRAHWQDPAAAPSEALQHKELKVDCSARTVSANGEALHLTYKEYQLLVYFLRHKGIALDRATLLRAMEDSPEEVFHQVVDKHIENLRKKLGSAAKYLDTVRGMGYRFG